MDGRHRRPRSPATESGVQADSSVALQLRALTSDLNGKDIQSSIVIAGHFWSTFDGPYTARRPDDVLILTPTLPGRYSAEIAELELADMAIFDPTYPGSPLRPVDDRTFWHGSGTWAAPHRFTGERRPAYSCVGF